MGHITSTIFDHFETILKIFNNMHFFDKNCLFLPFLIFFPLPLSSLHLFGKYWILATFWLILTNFWPSLIVHRVLDAPKRECFIRSWLKRILKKKVKQIIQFDGVTIEWWWEVCEMQFAGFNSGLLLTTPCDMSYCNIGSTPTQKLYE